MKVIPAINCPDWQCVKDKLAAASKFTKWAQIDIADGKFTKHRTWNKPRALQLPITNYQLPINIEVHLMVQNPERVVDDWIKAGARRIIVHLEAVKAREFSRIWAQISRISPKIEIGLAINPETPVQELVSYISINQSGISRNQRIRFVQVLAVNPGSSGQKFKPAVLKKIKFLKKHYPNVKIEVDGGINLETAKLCKKAGADILVAGSYIWESGDPVEAYSRLVNI